MFNLTDLSFEQAIWPLFGLSWDSIGVKFGVVVSVGSILGLLYQLYKKVRISRLLKKLNSIGFERILSKTAPELRISYVQSYEALIKFHNTFATGQVNGIDILFKKVCESYVECKGKLKLFVEDLEDFIRTHNGIYRLNPLITALISDDIKELLTLCSGFIDELQGHERKVADLEVLFKGGDGSAIEDLLEEFAKTYSITEKNFSQIDSIFRLILQKMDILLEYKKK